MQTTIYIRKENEEFWNLLGKDKSKWVNEQIGRGELEREEKTLPPEPAYEKVPSPTADKAPKLKVLTNSDLQTLLGGKAAPIKDEPQHGQRHICKDNCKHWIWDANSGKYNNSLTGEVRDAPEF